MLNKKKVTKSVLITGIILLIFASPIILNAFGFMLHSNDRPGPIYDVAIATETQQSILSICEEKDFSYELLMSIYHEDGVKDRAIQEVEQEITDLTSIRDYWAVQGYGDEDVFDFTIISRDLGIEGCEKYIEGNSDYKNQDYLIRVTEYKYYLDQERL